MLQELSLSMVNNSGFIYWLNALIISNLACVSQNSRELFGPEKLPVKLPKTISGVSQSMRTFRTRDKSRHFLPITFGC